MTRSVALSCVLAAGLSAAAHAGPISFTHNPGTYTFVAPTTGDYTIEALGGNGGNLRFSSGGLAADASGLFYLTAGEQLGIVVGSEAGGGTVASGGGGGSFVYVIATNTVLVAGGGGGGTYSSGNGGPNASTANSPLSESGGNVAGVNGTNGTCCGPGRNGEGGLSYVDISSSDGYVADGLITLAGGDSDGLVTLGVPAPEPASATLLAAGMTLLGWRRRRRSRDI